jgi:methylated-DNA-[protein]-cysteine S-methyltransferase
MSVVQHLLQESPVGTLLLVKTNGVLSGLYLPEHRHPPKEPIGPRVHAGFDDVTQQLEEYFARQRTEFDLPLAPQGTSFQQRVWTMLRGIPYGETWSYLQLAHALKMPTGTRAVGAANGRNPISIIVPCHRVIGANGSLTGYGGGIERKQFLLDHEGVMLQAPRLAF